MFEFKAHLPPMAKKQKNKIQIQTLSPAPKLFEQNLKIKANKTIGLHIL